MPLTTDDYIHMNQMGSGEELKAQACLTNSCAGSQFFRPLGLATYWVEWELWRTAALPRHAFDLILHGVTSVLFLLLVRALGVGPPFDWLAGLLFAWNGIRTEAVAWPAARFDTLALLFSLTAALAVLRGGTAGYIVSMVATAAACLSKESAYVLPLLLALLLGRDALRRRGRTLIASNFGVAILIFIWRWWALKGIGGYVSQNGAPTVLQFHAVTFVKTFLARIWGILAFPLNWSRPLEWWMMAGLTAGVVAFLLLLRSRPNRTRIILCFAGVVVACVPAHHMLLIDSSLERARYLDLATPAFTLMLVFACIALPRRTGIAALALMVVFQIAALEHNLGIWHSVSSARYEMCRTLAARSQKSSDPIVINDVPLIMDGVYWRNGIEECLWLDFGIPMGRVQINLQPAVPAR
jgi:hypothetical protein